MYCVCIDMKLDGIVGVGTCYGLDGLAFDPSRCKKLSSPYSSRPTHLFSLHWLWGSFLCVVLIATVSFILPSVCIELLCCCQWADFHEI